ncbi:cell shape determination protein CcmA [Rothia nasimurium]|uniref:Cell shape determination protein CcmA n=1 Tax=Rothia nasimurium TaxID=85336 RepID=A0A4Y9F1W3_9MICC|nr:cell shape determination protein CcmA [Rothia nasimurium]MBF0808739.1 cell shape determination protein CcmA [Rothia nasimurium]TFU21444.1 cell shape determination protein CcmA [Rothia nasimurium]
MNALLYALRDTQRLRTFLFWYWLISPFIFFFYQFAVSRGENVDFREMLNEPAIALAFIVSCMSLIMVGLLRAAETENENTERTFGMFAVAQQLLTGNIPGFLLSYFYTRSLWDAPREPFAPCLRWVILAGMALLGLLSLLTLLAYINLATG